MKLFLKTDYQLMIDNENKVADGLFGRANALHDDGLKCPNPTWAESYFSTSADYRRAAIEHLNEAEYWQSYLGKECCAQA